MGERVGVLLGDKVVVRQLSHEREHESDVALAETAIVVDISGSIRLRVAAPGGIVSLNRQTK